KEVERLATAGCPGLNTLRDPVPVATELQGVRTHDAAAWRARASLLPRRPLCRLPLFLFPLKATRDTPSPTSAGRRGRVSVEVFLKRIVICYDGTWATLNNPDEVTNVV